MYIVTNLKPTRVVCKAKSLSVRTTKCLLHIPTQPRALKHLLVAKKFAEYTSGLVSWGETLKGTAFFASCCFYIIKHRTPFLLTSSAMILRNSELWGPWRLSAMLHEPQDVWAVVYHDPYFPTSKAIGSASWYPTNWDNNLKITRQVNFVQKE